MNVTAPNSFRTGPDEHGRFGMFGGRFVAETLMPLILELEQAYADAKATLVDAIARWRTDVERRAFPGPAETLG